jgi:hypothetical protein
MLAGVDRDAIARAERRRQALEALEFERGRAAALRERLESIVVELDGAVVDDAVFEQRTPEEVEIVRPALQPPEDDLVDDAEEEEEGVDARAEQRAWLEEEIVRLQDELASSARRERAFERYLDVLG